MATEIKPIVNRDPLRRAYVQVIDPLYERLLGLDFNGVCHQTSSMHLRRKKTPID